MPKGLFRAAAAALAFALSFVFAADGEQAGDFWVRDRISRCPTAPIKRPPDNRDELLEPIEHYTDAFLSQVADEGVNGLWIPVRFRELAKTPYYPEDPQAERRAARLRGIVLQCWFFGGTPGLMNRAAGELSRSDFSEGEEDFLLRLACRDWGGDAPVVIGLWQSFSDAYAEYPLSNPVQYYGPFHASCTWDLLPVASNRRQLRKAGNRRMRT